MPHSFKRATRLWRHMLFTSIAALGALSITACSSDSDGPFVAAANVEAIILPTYIYQISATPAGNPLRVNVPDEAGMRTVSIHFGNTLNGRVNVSVDLDNNATVSNYSLHSQSSLAVNSDVGIPFLGAFVINVTEDMQFLAGEPPTTGALEITTLTETVTLRAVLNGVELIFGTGVPVILTWDQLESLLDSDLAIAWQRRAALAAEILEFVFVQAFGVTEALNFISDQLATVNPLVASCDAFTGSPPANVLVQGESTLTWMGLGTIPLGGDNFQWAFTDCWFDDSVGTAGQVLNGSIDLRNYVEVIDAEFRLIGTGFNEVIFNGLTIAETVENPPGIFTIDPNDTITVSGSFDLAFVGITN